MVQLNGHSFRCILFGVAVGAINAAAVAYGLYLSNTDKSQYAMANNFLALATCSDEHYVTVYFPGGGQYDCVPASSIKYGKRK